MNGNKKSKNIIKTTLRFFLNEENEMKQHYDLFDYHEKQPIELKKIVDKYSKILNNEKNYETINKFRDEVNKIGYTFDSGLDGEPYGLRPINVELNQL